MHLKNKIIYLLVLILSLSLVFPILNSYSFDSESLYVWSNNSTPLTEINTTSTTVSESNITSEKTRKFSKSYLWKCCFN